MFVIPVLAEIIARTRPGRFVDIGAKTGYLIDRLLTVSEFARRSELIAVESDRQAAGFMMERFRDTPSFRVDCVGIKDWADLPRISSGTLYLLSYTALELDDQSLAATFTRPGPKDTLVIVLPDTTEDIVSPADWRRYMAGDSVCIKKVDKFTGQTYPFTARRLSSWLPLALDTGLVLTHMQVYRTRAKKAHFLFEFHGSGSVS
jgi:hypothetical protein